MSDNEEIEFEGGFFEEAGVDPNDVADDQFGFGNQYWPVGVIEVGAPKVTANKDKIGMMVRFAVDHPDYQGSFVSGERGLGNQWFRLPVPLAVRGQIPWDPNGADEKKALVTLKQLYIALGFGADEFKKVNGKLMVGRRALTKIKPYQDDKGFWQFRLNNMKPIGESSGDGANEFTSHGQSNGGHVKSAAEIAAEELKREMGGGE
jgi:hypothetical protein